MAYMHYGYYNTIRDDRPYFISKGLLFISENHTSQGSNETLHGWRFSLHSVLVYKMSILRLDSDGET